MINTEIKTIPHNSHRYPTVGDYYDIDGKKRILVSDMRNETYEFLIAIHELVEEFLTRKRGISEEDITKFDTFYEANRQPNDHGEPGNSLASPYHEEHVFATFIERQLAIELGVNWDDYEEAVTLLDEPSNTGC